MRAMHTFVELVSRRVSEHRVMPTHHGFRARKHGRGFWGGLFTSRQGIRPSGQSRFVDVRHLMCAPFRPSPTKPHSVRLRCICVGRQLAEWQQGRRRQMRPAAVMEVDEVLRVSSVSTTCVVASGGLVVRAAKALRGMVLSLSSGFPWLTEVWSGPSPHKARRNLTKQVGLHELAAGWGFPCVGVCACGFRRFLVPSSSLASAFPSLLVSARGASVVSCLSPLALLVVWVPWFSECVGLGLPPPPPLQPRRSEACIANLGSLRAQPRRQLDTWTGDCCARQFGAPRTLEWFIKFQGNKSICVALSWATFAQSWPAPAQFGWCSANVGQTRGDLPVPTKFG